VSRATADVDLVALAVVDENYWRATVDLLKGLHAALRVNGYDDAEAESLAVVACRRWAAGEGAVSDRARALAAESLAVLNEAERTVRLAPRAGVAPSVHRPRRRSAPAASARRYVVVPSVHVPRGHR
jgi:hypothetical protein